MANLTRRDGQEFLALAPEVPVRTRSGGVSYEASQRRLERSAERENQRRGSSLGRLIYMPLGFYQQARFKSNDGAFRGPALERACLGIGK